MCISPTSITIEVRTDFRIERLDGESNVSKTITSYNNDVHPLGNPWYSTWTKLLAFPFALLLEGGLQGGGLYTSTALKKSHTSRLKTFTNFKVLVPLVHMHVEFVDASMR